MSDSTTTTSDGIRFYLPILCGVIALFFALDILLKAADDWLISRFDEIYLQDSIYYEDRDYRESIERHEISRAKSSDEIRVAFIGHCTAAGYGYLARSLQFLNKDDPRIEIYALGRDGFAAIEQLLLIEELPRYEPDIVVWATSALDFIDLERYWPSTSAVYGANLDRLLPHLEQFGLEQYRAQALLQGFGREIAHRWHLAKRRRFYRDILSYYFEQILPPYYLRPDPSRFVGENVGRQAIVRNKRQLIDTFLEHGDLNEQFELIVPARPHFTQQHFQTESHFKVARELSKRVKEMDVPMFIYSEPVTLKEKKYTPGTFDSVMSKVRETFEGQGFAFADYSDSIPGTLFYESIHPSVVGAFNFAKILNKDLHIFIESTEVDRIAKKKPR